MARARRDVDLVVRARNEASNVLSTITDALQRFNQGQRDTQRTAPDTSTAIDRIAQSYRSLTSGIGSGRVSTVIAREISRARNEFERYQASLQASQQNLARYSADSRRAADATRRLQAEVTRAQGRLETLQGLGTLGSSTPAVQRQRQALRELTQTLRAAEGEERRLSGAIRRTTAELKRNTDTASVAEARYKSIQGAARGTAAALEEVGQRARGTVLRAFGEQRQVLARTEALYRRNQVEATRLGRALASTVNPSREFSDAFQRAREATRAGAAELIRQRQALQQIRGALQETGGDLEDFVRRQAGARDVLASSRQGFRQYGETALRAAGATDRYSTSQARAREETRRQSEEVRRLAAEQRRLAQTQARETQTAVAPIRRDVLRSLTELNQRYTQAQQIYRRNQVELARLSQQLRQTVAPSRELIDAVHRTRAAVSQGGQTLALFRLRLQEVRAAYAETGGSVQDFVRRQNSVRASVKQAETAFRQQRDSVQRASQANDRLAASQARVAAAQRQTANETARVASTTRQAAAGTSALGRAYAELYGGTRQALSFTQRLRSEVLALITAYAGLFAVFRGIGNIAQASQVLQTVTNLSLIHI